MFTFDQNDIISINVSTFDLLRNSPKRRRTCVMESIFPSASWKCGWSVDVLSPTRYRSILSLITILTLFIVWSISTGASKWVAIMSVRGIVLPTIITSFPRSVNQLIESDVQRSFRFRTEMLSYFTRWRSCRYSERRRLSDVHCRDEHISHRWRTYRFYSMLSRSFISYWNFPFVVSSLDHFERQLKNFRSPGVD